jgi:hypothetical protein
MEKRMRIRIYNAAEPVKDERAATAKLSQKMAPFIQQLSVGCGNRSHSRRAQYLGGIKGISALPGLLKDREQIGGNRTQGILMLFKTHKLGMASVSFGFSIQHSLSQQGFAPQRNQTLSVKI